MSSEEETETPGSFSTRSSCKVNVTNQSGIIITYDHLIGLALYSFDFRYGLFAHSIWQMNRRQKPPWSGAGWKNVAKQWHTKEATTEPTPKPKPKAKPLSTILARTLISFIAPHISQSRKTIYVLFGPSPHPRLCCPFWQWLSLDWSLFLCALIAAKKFVFDGYLLDFDRGAGVLVGVLYLCRVASIT